MDLLLKGKKALVTGSGKGVGRGIALALANEGVDIALNYCFNEQTAFETLEMVKGTGVNATLIKADVSSSVEAKYLADAAAATLGGLDILVNNAALQKNLDITEYDSDSYDTIMNTNLKGYWNCIKFALPWLKQSKCPRIINIASVHSKRPTDFDPVYSMSKAGIKMLTRECALEFAKYHITVNQIYVGATKIEFKTGDPHTTKWDSNLRHRKRIYNAFLSTRVGEPADTGYVVCFLASELNVYINGAGIRLDGGAVLL